MSNRNTTQKDIANAKASAINKTPEQIAAEATKKAEEEAAVNAAAEAAKKAEEEAAAQAENIAETEAEVKAEIESLAKSIFEQYDLDVIYVTSDGSSAFETPELAESYDPDYVTVKRPA